MALDTDTLTLELTPTNYAIVCADRVGSLWRPHGVVGFVEVRESAGVDFAEAREAASRM